MKRESLFAVVGGLGLISIVACGALTANANERVTSAETGRQASERALAYATGAEFNPAIQFNREHELYRFGSALQGKGPNQVRLYRIDIRLKQDGFDSVIPSYVPRESVVFDSSVTEDRVVFHYKEVAGQAFVTVRMNPSSVREDEKPILLGN